MRLIIDTGVLWRPEALRALVELPHDRILPAVAFAERAREIQAAGREPAELVTLLGRCGIQVEPFTEQHALRYAATITDEGKWRILARDALIAGHVGPEDTLWTTDPEDFKRIGVPEDQIVPIE